jgi:hypothetical protein
VHLFGHTVQWNTSAEARRIGMLAPGQDFSQSDLDALTAYELLACRYSIALLHSIGVYDLDQWVSDFAGCDIDYLLHYYRTGDKRPFRDFWRIGRALITPMPIPEFSPTRWLARFDGVVV